MQKPPCCRRLLEHQRYVEIIAFLCSENINVNVNVEEAWEGAARQGHIGVLELLLSKNPTLGATRCDMGKPRILVSPKQRKITPEPKK